MNGILFHAVTHIWDNQAMVIRFDFESETFQSALKLFKHMEVVEAIYEGSRVTYKNKQPMSASKRISGRNQKGGKYTSHTSSAKIHTGKCKSNHADLLKREKTHNLLCMIHSAWNSSEE